MIKYANQSSAVKMLVRAAWSFEKGTCMIGMIVAIAVAVLFGGLALKFEDPDATFSGWKWLLTFVIYGVAMIYVVDSLYTMDNDFVKYAVNVIVSLLVYAVVTVLFDSLRKRKTSKVS